MTPTLLGRLQTRFFLLVTVGLAWTLLVTPLLPRDGAGLSESFGLTLTALATVTVIGLVGWEPIYHLLQQIRWEKDWPTGLGLVTGLPEGLVTYLVLAAERDVPVAAFVIHFSTTWLVVWLAVHGPLRIVLLRWRYRGGRIL